MDGTCLQQDGQDRDFGDGTHPTSKEKPVALWDDHDAIDWSKRQADPWPRLLRGLRRRQTPALIDEKRYLTRRSLDEGSPVVRGSMCRWGLEVPPPVGTSIPTW
jgi:hypothetical protein